jgi:hypothetical protein
MARRATGGGTVAGLSVPWFTRWFDGTRADALNLGRGRIDNASVGENPNIDLPGVTDMSRAAQIFLPNFVPADSVAKSENSEFDAIVLFSGIGLVVLLIAIGTGVQGVWF